MPRKDALCKCKGPIDCVYAERNRKAGTIVISPGRQEVRVRCKLFCKPAANTKLREQRVNDLYDRFLRRNGSK